MITVITPTYNRASLLPRVYESLCRQRYKDFEWVVVDDGSTDATKCLFAEGGQLATAPFTINYIAKENGGKHTAVNQGVKEAQGELVFILDSDDRLPDDALETVAYEFNQVKADATIGGVAGLDCYEDGRIVGTGLPREVIDCNAMDIRYKHRVDGDMKEVFRTEVLRQFPFPEIEGERFCPEQLVWFRIAQRYRLHYFNRPIYIAEYQADGITAGITRARMNSPVAACMTYAEMLDYPIPPMQKLKAAINYWRFYACLPTADRAPRVAWKWQVVRPLGQAMHWRDKKNK